jgi:methionyl-tRNA formyltransferase
MEIELLDKMRDALAARFAESAALPGAPLADLNPAMIRLGLRPFPDAERPAPVGVSLEGIAPLFKNLPLCGLSQLRAWLQDGINVELVSTWAEKLFRWFEIRRREVWPLARKKWTTKRDAEIGLLELCCFFLEYYSRSNDARFLNAALKFDRVPLPSRKKWFHFFRSPDDRFEIAVWHFRREVLLSIAISEVAEWNRTPRTAAPAEVVPPAEELVLDPAAFAGRPAPRVCIFSPNPYSFFTLATTELLCRAGVRVESLFVRRLFNPKRAWFEYHRDGAHFFKKIYRKLLFRRSKSATLPFETMPEFLERHDIHHQSVDTLAKARGFPVHRCWDLNDANVVKHLRENSVDMVVFTGGGLIREEVLAHAGRGVLSVHPGVLPLFRGWDVMEWAILKNCPDWVGCTVHFMERGVDTGPYLVRYRIDYSDCSNPHNILLKFEPIITGCLVSACLGLLRGELTPKAQREEDGKQYFYMHPRLIDLVAKRMQDTCILPTP